jgi:hypothetical protein
VFSVVRVITTFAIYFSRPKFIVPLFPATSLCTPLDDGDIRVIDEAESDL